MGWCGLDCVGSRYTATLLEKIKKAADLHNLTSCFFIPEMTHFDNLATAKYQIFKIKIVRRFKKKHLISIITRTANCGVDVHCLINQRLAPT
jgi:hypothetical protein